MVRLEMATFPLTVLLTVTLSITFVSTLSEKHRDKLDEIEQLLRRLQNEIDHIRGTDNARHTTRGPSVRNSTDVDVTAVVENENKTETSSFETNDNRNLTTQFENPTTQQTKSDSDATKVLDLTTVDSELRTTSNNRAGLDLTTGLSATHPDDVHSTVSSRSEVTEGLRQMTTGEAKDGDAADKDDHEDKEKAENELREVENVRRLIDEGEDLERQLKGVFSQLRSLSQCTPVGEACGVRQVAKCCRGLKCSATWSGICYLDCVPYGKSCSENFFCCSGYQCVKSFDRNAENQYICQ